jgi:hypothetical protein
MLGSMQGSGGDPLETLSGSMMYLENGSQAAPRLRSSVASAQNPTWHLNLLPRFLSPAAITVYWLSRLLGMQKAGVRKTE